MIDRVESAGGGTGAGSPPGPAGSGRRAALESGEVGGSAVTSRPCGALIGSCRGCERRGVRVRPLTQGALCGSHCCSACPRVRAGSSDLTGQSADAWRESSSADRRRDTARRLGL